MRIRIKQSRLTVLNETIRHEVKIQAYANAQLNQRINDIINSGKSELSKLTKLIENISNENAFTKEEKIFDLKKEVPNHSMISLPSGLKDNSDAQMPKLWINGTLK